MRDGLLVMWPSWNVSLAGLPRNVGTTLPQILTECSPDSVSSTSDILPTVPGGPSIFYCCISSPNVHIDCGGVAELRY